MVWPTRIRHRERKHAFEEALDEARDDDLEGFLDEALSNPALGPAVGSFGDISVASSYVATASLTRAYGGDDDRREEPVSDPPAEAARKLKALIEEKPHTVQELARFRRRFAAQYHPDKVVPELRDEAVSAMSEINAAIDRALKRGKSR